MISELKRKYFRDSIVRNRILDKTSAALSYTKQICLFWKFFSS